MRPQPYGRESYLSPEEAAGLLNVSCRSVYSWLRGGSLKGIKVGKYWRINKGVVMSHPRIKYGLGRENGYV